MFIYILHVSMHVLAWRCVGVHPHCSDDGFRFITLVSSTFAQSVIKPKVCSFTGVIGVTIIRQCCRTVPFSVAQSARGPGLKRPALQDHLFSGYHFPPINLFFGHF